MSPKDKKYSQTVLVSIGLICIVSVMFNIILLYPKKESRNEKYANQKEEYIFMPPFINDPLVNEQDIKGLKQFAEENGVDVTVMAPDQFDAVATASMFRQAIERKPAGIMICATDTILIPYINEAMEKGIPVVTVDADRPESKRLSYVGSNWQDIGTAQAEALVKLVGGNGIVAGLGIAGNTNMEDGWEGFHDVMDEYEDISVLGMFDDVSNRDEARRITLNLLAEYPEIEGIAAFDSNSAFGICAALEETNKIQDVAVVSVDMTKEHIELLKKGYIKRLVGQKRELFAYYGGKLLYDYNHGLLTIANQDIDHEITNIPEVIETGIVIIDEDDVK